MNAFNADLSHSVRDRIRDVPDFPKPGIVFKDLTPVWGHGPTLRAITDAFVARYGPMEIDVFAGIESRGFLTATPVGSALETGVVLLRKPGKLPWETVYRTYKLEYGQDTLEMHADAIRPGMRVVIVDDLLATGGTMRAAIDLIREQGGEIVEVAVLIELGFLKGREGLDGVSCSSLVTY